MQSITATDARAKLYELLDQVGDSREPVLITGRRANAVLISEDQWHAIEETLYLSSIPGMSASIIEGMNTPIEGTSELMIE
jgi:antitoxin YefM